MRKSSTKFVISHPTGNTFVHALLNQLHKHDKLEKFFTTIGAGEGTNFLIKLLSEGKREYPIPDKMISRQWRSELARLLSKGDQAKKRQRTDNTYLSLDLKASKELINLCSNILHRYEDGCSFSFSQAKKLSMQCSYELPIAHWSTARRFLSE